MDFVSFIFSLGLLFNPCDSLGHLNSIGAFQGPIPLGGSSVDSSNGIYVSGELQSSSLSCGFDLYHQDDFDRFNTSLCISPITMSSDLVKLSPVFEVNSGLDRIKLDKYVQVSVNLGVVSDIQIKGFHLCNEFLVGYLPVDRSVIFEQVCVLSNTLTKFSIRASKEFYGFEIGGSGSIVSYQYAKSYDSFWPTLIDNEISFWVSTPTYKGISCKVQYEHNCVHPEAPWGETFVKNINEMITLLTVKLIYRF